MNWNNVKRTLWSMVSRKKDDDIEEQPAVKTLVFDRPFDFYLYDRRRQIVFASGTVSGP